jgi:hypothetical protein
VLQRHRRHLLAEGLALLLHPRRIPFFRVPGFLLAADPISLQCPKDRHHAAGDTQAIPQFRKRCIRLLPHQFKKASNRRGVQLRGHAATMGFGLNRAGAAIALEPTYNGREIDGEKRRQLAKRMFTRFDQRHNARSKIKRKRSHLPPPGSCDPHLSLVFYTSATQVRTALG